MAPKNQWFQYLLVDWGSKWPQKPIWFSGKMGHFQVILPPQRGAWYGPQGPLKEGVRGPPRPPKSVILGHFGPFRAKNGQSSRFRPEIGLKTPPITHFFIKFRKNPGYPPWKLKNRKKPSRFRPEIFQNFRKVIENGALFGQSWDFGAPYRISGVKIADLPCQYPQPPAFFGPSYVLLWFVDFTMKGSQRLRPS